MAAPPNIAGTLISFVASFGSDLAKEMVLVAGTLWIEYAPIGHDRFCVYRKPAERRRTPPVLEAWWNERLAILCLTAPSAMAALPAASSFVALIPCSFPLSF